MIILLNWIMPEKGGRVGYYFSQVICSSFRVFILYFYFFTKSLHINFGLDNRLAIILDHKPSKSLTFHMEQDVSIKLETGNITKLG